MTKPVVYHSFEEKAVAEKKLGEVTIEVISYEDLIENKGVINRKMDQKDIESLENIRKKKGEKRP